jgi:hypothetical protein
MHQINKDTKLPDIESAIASGVNEFENSGEIDATSD